ncbi:DUF2971 domain-containing protein [Aeromonas veronii]|uniref:DUF2971 domain-containing protein n=1 Tax=Aeromonas veronii TaxID=654 RepID=UPI001117B12C|nr:DUF2971 domain-containing protein [Aeromonas veronii]TNJ08972.1 hypothetical protein CF107_14760 [Aeromonas veronii]
MAPPSRQEGFREGRGWGRIPPVLLHGGAQRAMKTLFKYSSYIERFFTEPSIKLSNIKALNDPFESEINKHILDRIVNTVRHHKLNKWENFIEAKLTRKSLESIIGFNGVISYSETPRNLLMWAHYGDQHSGMCVGFNSNVLNYLSNKKKNLHTNLSVYKPIKVNYDSRRIDPTEIADKKDVLKDILISYLTTKSDEWIYEKEHRSIISAHHVDEIIVSKNLNIPILGEDGKMGITGNDIIGILLNEKKIKKIKENVYRINKSALDVVDCSILLDIPQSSNLIHVNPRFIETIYFGCRVGHKKIQHAFDLINKNEKMKHISVFHYSLNENRFELTPNLVSSEYISALKSVETSYDY